ncbi:MAG: hypothetical protein RL739_1634, partial [Pseudomonadota bacterium]
ADEAKIDEGMGRLGQAVREHIQGAT